MMVTDPTVFSVVLTSNDTAAILNPAGADITIEDEDSKQLRALQVHMTWYSLQLYVKFTNSSPISFQGLQLDSTLQPIP